MPAGSLRRRLLAQKLAPLRERPAEALGKGSESAASPALLEGLSGSLPAAVRKSSSRLGRTLNFS